MNIAEKIAQELQVKLVQVVAAIQLLDEGSTVPFIARYRKEVTGGLDDTQLRNLEERLYYLRELEERRHTILQSIKEQEKLTPELEQSILAADNKATLEDLYLPYKPKRRTKAQIAKEAGLEPLALGLLENPKQKPEELAANFINAEKGIENIEQALEGAKQILMELFAEHANLLGELREHLWGHAVLESKVCKGKETEAIKFSDYFAYQEALAKIPSHRALALFRGQRESFLMLNVILENAEEYATNLISKTFSITKNTVASSWLFECVRMSWNIKIFTKLEIDVLTRLREMAEIEAIKVFADNVRQLLMAAPAGSRVTMGLDPGLRTGVKCVVVDTTGKLLINTTIFPHAPKNDWDASINIIAKICKELKVELVSIGNGTASRETDKLVAEVIKKHPDLNITKVVVSEAGASIYSASEFAAKEFPDLDVTYRGAVSIARRLQDPLAELIKIDPKSIGVGQYQHDVNQSKLGKSLHAVLEDCVNAVGVDLNMASVPLLASVSGLSESTAKQIVEFRDKNGSFQSRDDLKKVPRLGAKTFEQAAGFLRILNGNNPLDCSAVHPESYSLVEKILTKQQKSIREMMGNSEIIRQIKPQEYIDDHFGLPTVIDILKELEKPGRDPRPEFKTATFKDGVENLTDLKPEMILEGTVTNVANFGAFVDIGVHQDGLVHVSELADRFVKDPKEVVKVGDIVKVKVVEIDIPRKRIALSMKLSGSSKPKDPAIKTQEKSFEKKSQSFEKKFVKPQMPAQPKNTAFADALKGLIK